MHNARLNMAGLGTISAFLLLLSYVASHGADAASAYSKPQPLAVLCNTTTYTSLCLATLAKYPSSQPSALLQDLTAFLVSQALTKVNRTYWIGKRMAAQEEEAGGKFTLQDCLEMLDDAVEGLNRSVDRLSHLDARPQAPPGSLREQVMDVRVWLSSALTYVDTCWDELGDPKAAPLKARFSSINNDIEPLLAIALSMAQALQQEGGASTAYALPRHHRPSPRHPR